MRDLVGRTLGQYQVLELLGEGGMARVYKVWDTVRSTHLALKLLHEDLAEDKIFIRRFQREAQTLERLQHPNIVRFYGLERQGIQAFIVVDFIDGFTLRTEIVRMEGHPMSAGRIMEIMRPVCSALQYAHSQDIAHCDIKPANIMVSRNGTVLVSDFGIARVTEGAATMTMAGAGTPAYMSPEQIRGENPTPQSDIYGLGVVLFEMLTGGERPFTGEAAKITGTSGEKVRWEHINISPQSPRKYNKEIPLDLEAVVLKCLAKDPARRYETPMELLTALEAALASYKVRTFPGSRLNAAEDVTLPPIPGFAQASGVASQFGAAATPSGATRNRRWIWIAAAVAVFCIAVTAIGGFFVYPLLNPTPETAAPPVIAPTFTPYPTSTAYPTETALPTEPPEPTDAPPPTENPNVIEGSKPLAANESYNGTTQNGSELFYFNGREGQLVTIVVTGINHFQTFSIRNDKNVGLVGSNTDNQSITAIRSFKLPYTGLFYILVDRTDSPQYGKYCRDRWGGSTQAPVWCFVGGPYTIVLTFE